MADYHDFGAVSGDEEAEAARRLAEDGGKALRLGLTIGRLGR